MITSPVFRAASRLLTRNNVRAFCFEKGMLDPSKHIYMNHVAHNVYVDYWEIGQYPELILQGSIAPRTYEPKIKQVILEILNKKYNVQPKEADILNEEFSLLLKYIAKTEDTPDVFINELLKKLSTAFFVRESKWTWIIEQRYRFTSEFNEQFYGGRVNTISEFLQTYNFAIEKAVLGSHLGTNSKIPQSPTPQQKQFYNQINDQVTGVAELYEEKVQNKGVINRFMKALHSI